jgi:arginine/lysine/ornithine decarboxylase
MTAPGDTEEALLRLGRALLEIDANLSPAKVERAGTAPAARHKVYTLAEAANSEKVCIPLEDAEGRISAEYLFVYPPGVPLLIPGEEISAELISEIKEMSGSGLGLKSSYKTAPERVFVLK